MCERFWKCFASIFPFKKTADPSNICQQTFYIVNFCIAFVKAKGNIRPSRLKYYSTILKVDLNFFHKNCACFDDFLEITVLPQYCNLGTWEIADMEIDFGKKKKWWLFFILMTSHHAKLLRGYQLVLLNAVSS